ncbi:MAG: hypothetical protein IJ667_10450 [Synergistaceae bacterium]|nr:hypothetical protein [Synergistaceae bacterium]
MEQDSWGVVEPESNIDFKKIKKTVLADIQRANAFYTEKVEHVLRRRHQIYEADRKYYKKRFPNTDGQSKFVSYDFWSMVQWAIPSVMNSFFGTDEAVAIIGRNSEDVSKGEKFKQLIDYQIMTQNPGFLLLWDWFSDAFQYGLGAIKVWWKREAELGEVSLDYIDGLNLQQLMQNPWCEIINVEGPDMFGGYFAQYQVKRLKENKPILEPVRVTDLRWSPEARSLDEANFIAQRKAVTADHLRRQAQAGVYDIDAVERALKADSENGIIWTDFEKELNDETGEYRNSEEDPARGVHELYECYIKLDINGDGLLEDAIVTVVSDEIIRLEENPWGRAPIFALSPVRDPFKVLSAISFAEIVGEIQDLKTALIRQFIINTVKTNNLQWFINDTQVNIADLKENRQFIRTNGDPRTIAVPFPQAGVAPWTMNFFEYLEGTLEQWTGRTRYNQGTDSSSLNKTATGISLLQQASEQRIDYIVRVFAETGMKELLRFLVRLNQQYIDQAQVIRLNNQPLEISLDDLSGEFDIDVNTEAGVGRRKQNIQNLQFYLSAIAPTGMQIGAITPGEWARAAQKLLSDSGIRDPESYILDPEIIKQQFFMQMGQQMALQQAQQAQELLAPEESKNKSGGL